MSRPTLREVLDVMAQLDQVGHLRDPETGEEEEVRGSELAELLSDFDDLDECEQFVETQTDPISQAILANAIARAERDR